MKRVIEVLFFVLFFLQFTMVEGQKPVAGTTLPKLEIYYFHPTERCPIDQSIEETTRKMMRTDFAKETGDGTIRFRVLNTDDKANAKTVERFEMNAQALYLVWHEKGTEVKKDLTEFAFSTCQSNPSKFKAGFRDEILAALKK